MNFNNKYVGVEANLITRSEFKDLMTGKGVEFCNVLACPRVGTALRLNFYGYRASELRVLTGSELRNGTRLDIKGHMTGCYDEKPDITVVLVRIHGMDHWLDLRQGK